MLAFGHRVAPRRPPLCPELRLWLLAEEIDLESACRDLGGLESPPYWAFSWGSGQALARYLLDHSARIRDRDVVDFGAGGGIVAIAAARSGARSVLAVDCDAGAREAIRANAALNRRPGDVPIEIAATVPPPFLAPDGPPPDAAEQLIAAADVLYEAANRSRLFGLPAPGRSMLLADPLRPGAPRIGARTVARYPVRTEPDVDSPCHSAVVFELPQRAAPDRRWMPRGTSGPDAASPLANTRERPQPRASEAV